MNSTKIGIVGCGHVGKAMAQFFESHYHVIKYDPTLKDSATKKEINKCDFSFVCVPTPRDKDGSCDTSIVEETIKWLSTKTIVIKSTISVGTTDYLVQKYNKDIIFSPEHIGESTYWTPYKFHSDMVETPFFIFGGDKKICSRVVDLFLPVTGPCKKYTITDSKSAEMSKYIRNVFYATKVAFCNEMYDICEQTKVDWNVVRELWLLDPRLHEMHTAVFKDNRGFGGKCFPKDISALLAIAENNAPLLRGVIDSNDKVRKQKPEGD